MYCISAELLIKHVSNVDLKNVATYALDDAFKNIKYKIINSIFWAHIFKKHKNETLDLNVIKKQAANTKNVLNDFLS